jgi:hypothetical protein
MTGVDEILKRREAAILILQEKLEQAIALRNAGAAGMEDIINALAAQRADIAAHAYTGGLDDPTAAQALTALNAATTEMKASAAKMVSVTTFIANIARLRTATMSVVSALDGDLTKGMRPPKRGVT